MVKTKSPFEKYKYPILVIGGAAVITFALVFAIAKPMWDSTKKVNAELKEKKETLTSLSDRLSKLQQLKEKEAELKEKNAKVLAALPEDKDVARLFVQFEGIAAGSGIKIISAGEQGAQTGGNPTTTKTQSTSSEIIKPINYSISANGTDYSSLKGALSKFEEALRLLSISSIDITKNASTFDIKFEAVTYARSAK